MKKQILITDFELRKGIKKQLGICCIKEINIEKELGICCIKEINIEKE